MGKSERRRSRPGLAPAQSVATVRERMRVLRGYRWSSYRAYLPAKEPVVREGFMHPFGRAALDELKRLGNRKSRGQREQDADVVRHAPNLTRALCLDPGAQLRYFAGMANADTQLPADSQC